MDYHTECVLLKAALQQKLEPAGHVWYETAYGRCYDFLDALFPQAASQRTLATHYRFLCEAYGGPNTQTDITELLHLPFAHLHPRLRLAIMHAFEPNDRTFDVSRMTQSMLKADHDPDLLKGDTDLLHRPYWIPYASEDYRVAVVRQSHYGFDTGDKQNRYYELHHTPRWHGWQVEGFNSVPVQVVARFTQTEQCIHESAIDLPREPFHTLEDALRFIKIRSQNARL